MATAVAAAAAVLTRLASKLADGSQWQMCAVRTALDDSLNTSAHNLQSATQDTRWQTARRVQRSVKVT